MRFAEQDLAMRMIKKITKATKNSIALCSKMERIGALIAKNKKL